MDPDNAECMFCHEGLPISNRVPENLAFMSHVQDSLPCHDEHEAWKTNMQTDFKGD